MRSKCLIVGSNSFIGKSLYKSNNHYDIISYKDILNTNLAQYSVLVNCSFHPSFKNQKYNEYHDIDYNLLRLVSKYNCHYVMLSSRKVYGSSDELKVYTEQSPLNPYDFYSENKLITETKLLAEFGDKITILRGSNIFGFEPNRKSFMGFCLDQLRKNNTIEFQISENTKRDFLHIDTACAALQQIIRKKPKGIFNLSSNLGYNIGIIPINLIIGYGAGSFISSNRIQEQFILSNHKILNALNINIAHINISSIVQQIGQQLFLSK